MRHDPFTILLIEDDPGDEAMTLRALRGCDLPVSVRVAHDGVQGLHALGLDGSDAEIPDLVLSDIKMPKVDGPEVLRRVRADDRLRNVPFVLFSSSDAASEIRRARDLGATEYRTKPIELGAYTECVREIARRWLDWRDAGADVREAIRVARA